MPIVKLVSSGIGLAFEANAARKAHKTDKAARSIGGSPLPEPSQSEPAEKKTTDVSHDRPMQRIRSSGAIPVILKDQNLKSRDYDEHPPTYAEAEEIDKADLHLYDAIPDAAGSPSSDNSIFSPVPNGEAARKHYVDKIVQDFVALHPSPFPTTAVGNLPYPVIIPQ